MRRSPSSSCGSVIEFKGISEYLTSNEQFNLRPLYVTMVFAIPLLVFVLSNCLVNDMIAGEGEKRTGVVVAGSFLVSAAAFLLYGPMIPLSRMIPASMGLVVVSQLLFGVSLAGQHIGSLVLGMRELKDMGMQEDAGHGAAFAAIFLTAYSVGSVHDAVICPSVLTIRLLAFSGSLGPLIGGFAIHVSSHEAASALMFGLQILMVSLPVSAQVLILLYTMLQMIVVLSHWFMSRGPRNYTPFH